MFKNSGYITQLEGAKVGKKLKYFALKKKLFLFKKIRVLDWSVSYRKKDPKTRIFVTKYHRHMGKSYTKKTDNRLASTPENLNLADAGAQAWAKSVQSRIQWSSGLSPGYIARIKHFKYFRHLCEWNRRATSI